MPMCGNGQREDTYKQLKIYKFHVDSIVFFLHKFSKKNKEYLFV